jgi:ribosome-binding protein aMBF1 (putative translation factor)
LGIARRKIIVSRRHIPTNRHPRKALPKALKTLGDHIQVKRFEKGLTRSRLARMLEVPPELVTNWERDLETPNDGEWQALAQTLSFETGFSSLRPNS